MSVRFEVVDHVATVTIDRPEVMNAIDLATEAELLRIWAAIEADDDVRVVVLTGAGERAFCVGADLKNPSIKGVDYWAAARPGGFGGIALRETLNVPVIARVNGFALGGGFEMVLGCDIVVACDEASFGLPEPLVGRLPLDGGMTLLQRQIPFRQAMGMMLTGQRIKAQRALELGLINEVVPRAELDTAVERWSAAILACAPLSLQGDQAGRAPDRARCRRRRPRRCACRRWSRRCSPRTPTKACSRSSRSASPSGRGAEDGGVAYVITTRLHRRQGRRLREVLSGRLHLRRRAHALHPPGRMHRLRGLRVGLSDAGHLRGSPAAGAAAAVPRRSTASSSSRRSAAWARRAAPPTWAP